MMGAPKVCHKVHPMPYLPACPRCLAAGMPGALVAQLSAGLQPVWAAADTSGRRGAADAFAGARALVSPAGLIRNQPCPLAAACCWEGQSVQASSSEENVLMAPLLTV